MGAFETAFWIVFIFVCVIAVHPAIDIAVDCKWKMDDMIVWIRSRNLPTWGRLQELFQECTDNAASGVQPYYHGEYNVVKRSAWASFFRNECTFADAVNKVSKWAEARK